MAQDSGNPSIEPRSAAARVPCIQMCFLSDNEGQARKERKGKGYIAVPAYENSEAVVLLVATRRQLATQMRPGRLHRGVLAGLPGPPPVADRRQLNC
eukprot:1154270-Pelagomonas_calceolata.AAC.1